MTHFERSNPSYVKGRIQGIRGQDEKEHRLRGGGLCLRPGGPGQRLRAGPDPGGLLRQATPIQQIAAISSPDARTLLISPWDGSALKLIEKAIQNSDLGINPQNDGKALRLAFPQLTEERRKELVKQIRKYAESGKVAVRNIRRDAMDNFKKQEKKSEITEDELKQVEKDFQKLTDESCKKLDELLAKKEKELMAV